LSDHCAGSLVREYLPELGTALELWSWVEPNRHAIAAPLPRGGRNAKRAQRIRVDIRPRPQQVFVVGDLPAPEPPAEQVVAPADVLVEPARVAAVQLLPASRHSAPS